MLGKQFRKQREVVALLDHNIIELQPITFSWISSLPCPFLTLPYSSSDLFGMDLKKKIPTVSLYHLLKLHYLRSQIRSVSPKGKENLSVVVS